MEGLIESSVEIILHGAFVKICKIVRKNYSSF